MIIKAISNMKLRAKLLSAFLVVAVILIVTLTIAIIDVNNTVKLSDEVINYVVEPLSTVFEARMTIEKMKVEGRDILLERDIQKQTILINDFLGRITFVKSLMQDFYESMRIEDARVYYREFLETINIYEANMIIFREKISRGDSDVDLFLIEDLSPFSEHCMVLMANMSDLRLEHGRILMRESLEISESILQFLIILAVFGVGFTVIFGFYFSISISRPILLCTEKMIIAAKGDYTVRLPETYGAEIGQLFEACNSLLIYDDMISVKLKGVTESLRSSAQNMLLISTNMENSSKDLNQHTSSVSISTEEFSAGMTQSSNAVSTASSHISAVASSIEEINVTISTVATAAEETSTMVEQSSQLVDNIQKSITKASESVKLVSGTFNNVANSVNEINKSILVVQDRSVKAKNNVADADEKAKNTNEIIRRLDIASKQIGKIITVISDIADQTNMLALNAAIEAAGAGEAGKGFMVVANEVKELAKQTTEATKEIANEIENMQLKVPEAVTAVSEITMIINGMTEYINTFAQEITQQGKRSDEIASESSAAAKQMNDISSEVNIISENAQSVTRTVLDSTRGVNEIAKSTAELVIGSQEIAMNSERASNNMSEINRATREMASGLIDISKTVQHISEETNVSQQNTISIRNSSEELLKMANELETLVSNFITS
ncbi:MAG: methyl-accepting chemotaxis protein [Treponema sp.]|nr:methyl-accepting chemotaxis protein [Treponema sp.]